jgi:hypothetical protein
MIRREITGLNLKGVCEVKGGGAVPMWQPRHNFLSVVMWSASICYLRDSDPMCDADRCSPLHNRS